jgi:hypothetical protein
MGIATSQLVLLRIKNHTQFCERCGRSAWGEKEVKGPWICGVCPSKVRGRKPHLKMYIVQRFVEHNWVVAPTVEDFDRVMRQVLTPGRVAFQWEEFHMTAREFLSLPVHEGY